MMELETYLKQHYSLHTVAGYRQRIERYLSEEPQAATADYTSIVAYLGRLRTRPSLRTGRRLSGRSLHHHLHAIKIYYNYLQATSQREDHPCRYLQLKDPVPRQVALEQLYTDEQLRGLEQHFTERPLYERVIVSLLVHQGLSSREIMALQRGDVDLEQGRIRIAEGVQLERSLPLQVGQILLLQSWLQSDPTTQLLLPGHQGQPGWPGRINRLLNRNRPPDQPRWRAQRIRQSVIAQRLRRGEDIRRVQLFAGHRRTASTEAYRQDALEELKVAVQKYHPLR